MAETVTLAGVNYTIPDPGEQPNWATGLTPYLVAVAANIASAPAFMQPVSVSASPTTTVSGKTYLVTTSSVAITLNLPTPATNMWIIVKDATGTAATHNITLHRPGSQTIDGTAADKVLSRNFGSWIISSDGTNYFVLNEFPDSGLLNTDIAAGAAIAYSKLALTGSIVNADIASAAAIAVNKLAALTVSKPVRSDASGFLTTGNTSLTSEVTGTLPVGNGGTNSATSLNNNRIMVSSGGSIVEAAALSASGKVVGTDANGIPSTTAQALSMQSQKLTSLANGTTSTDAAAFGQIGVLQTVQGTYATQTSSTSTTYADTGITVSITPKVSTSAVYLSFDIPCAVAGSSAGSIPSMDLIITDSSNTTIQEYLSALAMNDGIAQQQTYSQIHISAKDLPGSTSAKTYKVRFRVNSNFASSVTVKTCHSTFGQSTAFFTAEERQ